MLIRTIGFLAGILTTFSFLPQVIKTYQTKRADDFNLTFMLMFTVGLIFWNIYGIMIGEWPIIAANSVTLALNFVLLGMKLRYKKKQ
jgi:MtN3 and saliva related transmembrane protein